MLPTLALQHILCVFRPSSCVLWYPFHQTIWSSASKAIEICTAYRWLCYCKMQRWRVNVSRSSDYQMTAIFLMTARIDRCSSICWMPYRSAGTNAPAGSLSATLWTKWGMMLRKCIQLTLQCFSDEFVSLLVYRESSPYCWVLLRSWCNPWFCEEYLYVILIRGVFNDAVSVTQILCSLSREFQTEAVKTRRRVWNVFVVTKSYGEFGSEGLKPLILTLNTRRSKS
jgi:hypothetical protein